MGAGGHPAQPNAELWLGPKLSDPDPTEAELELLHSGLLEQSFTAIGVNRVTPGDASTSFLMMKLQDAHNSHGFECEADGTTDEPCGDRMPPLPSPPLCDGELELIRGWIEQGASSN